MALIKLCSTDGNILVDDSCIYLVVDQDDTRGVHLRNGKFFEVSDTLETIHRKILLGYTVVQSMGKKTEIIENQ